jgi:hypothetical protein
MSTKGNMIPSTLTSNGNIGFYFDGKMQSIGTDHPNYNKIKEAIKNGDGNALRRLVDVPKVIERFSSNRVRVENGVVYYGEKALHNTLTKRILALMQEGFGFDHMIKFVDNIYQNPSNRAVNELYDFLDHFALPITEDGCFLAYKAVRNDYYSITAGAELPITGKYRKDHDGNRLFNGIGETLELIRNEVDDNREQHCSKGLHCGAIGYVKSFGNITDAKPNVSNGGNRVMVIKVNPKDAVSVPSDCSCEKIRVCKYEIIGEMDDLTNLLTKAVYTSTGTDLDPDYNEDDDCCGCDGCDDETPHYNDESCCCDEDNGCDHCLGDSSDSCPDDYDAGYERGFKDGKSHARKLHKDEDESEYSNGYVNGYNEARKDEYKQKPILAPTAVTSADINDYDTGYADGWRDGTNGRPHTERVLFKTFYSQSEKYQAGYNDGYEDSAI